MARWELLGFLQMQHCSNLKQNNVLLVNKHAKDYSSYCDCHSNVEYRCSSLVAYKMFFAV